MQVMQGAIVLRHKKKKYTVVSHRDLFLDFFHFMLKTARQPGILMIPASARRGNHLNATFNNDLDS